MSAKKKSAKKTAVPSAKFSPSGVAMKNGRYFGLPYTLDEADIVILPVPIDVTTSYRDGTHLGPQSVLEASTQVDLFSPYLERAWEMKLSNLPIPKKMLAQNAVLRREAKKLIGFFEKGGELEKSRDMAARLNRVNKELMQIHDTVERDVDGLLAKGKRVLVLGGDHSVSLGGIRAEARRNPGLSVLHFDAHADLRVDYEGFPNSHASIMNLVQALPGISKLVQVGIRDVSPDEVEVTRTNPKVKTYFDWDLKKARYSGRSFTETAKEIVAQLSDTVHISFDIDGLDPKLCPSTGTPVPGGVEFEEVAEILRVLAESGKKIIGADLVEVAPPVESRGPGRAMGEDWDSNVGARALYLLACVIESSRRKRA